MTTFDEIREHINTSARRWLVTGGAGFIGSHLVEHLLKLGQQVVVLDNFATGHRANLDHARENAGEHGALEFIEGDIRDADVCRRACAGVDHVLHQAALGSVPRSMKDPLASHLTNTHGFLNVLMAAHEAGAQSIVYASSSSVYGDSPMLPKSEEQVGRPLSPYAATKVANEAYANAFALAYKMKVIGLRYFNVFGPRQDPNGPYAAVMPVWFAALLADREVTIHGDGETSRDFCYIENVVQVNLLAALASRSEAFGQVYNVALGKQTTLKELFALIRDRVTRYRPDASTARPRYGDFRPGDVRHSLADVSKARRLLGYTPTHDVAAGLELAGAWYAKQAIRLVSADREKTPAQHAQARIAVPQS
jgi:UDP-N-acetylglucosamine 4-epimerase